MSVASILKAAEELRDAFAEHDAVNDCEAPGSLADKLNASARLSKAEMALRDAVDTARRAAPVSASPEVERVLNEVEAVGLSSPEKAAIAAALRAGAQFGYGNVIAWLQTAWATSLRDNHGLDEATAIRATAVSPYRLPPKRRRRE